MSWKHIKIPLGVRLYLAHAVRGNGGDKRSPITTRRRTALRWYQGLKKRYPASNGWVHTIKTVLFDPALVKADP